MKRLPFLVMAVLSVCHCGPGAGAGVAGAGGAGELRGYKLGLMKGGADRAAGLSATPARYESEYSNSERNDFFRGYQKGYSRGGR